VRDALLVATGGALGSLARWLVSGWVQGLSPTSTLPWSTFVVNAVGSFTIGVLLVLALERALVPPQARLFLVTGVLGGFTTFSAFSWESLALLRDAQWAAAAAYTLGSVAVGLLAAFGGAALASRF
jgi:CrcB protein